jgi:hypothetical protein
MPSLAGAITVLGLGGLSVGAPFYDSEYQTSPRPFTQQFTQLGLGGLSTFRHADFSGKTEITTAPIVVSDTASLSATEDPFDRNEIATTDTARLSASDVSQLFNRIDVSETASLAAGETISVVISGVTLKTASDTASLTATDASAVGVSIAVTDTATLTASESATVAVSAENISVSDTASLSADDVQLLEIFAGIVEKVVSDSAIFTVSDSAAVAEVRRIRKITFEPRMPRITFEAL